MFLVKSWEKTVSEKDKTVPDTVQGKPSSLMSLAFDGRGQRMHSFNSWEGGGLQVLRC